jgi:hypothetical protein
MKRVVFAVLMLVAGTTALATETVPSVLRDVVGAAELIVRGQVTDVRVVSRVGRRVESVASVAVDAVLKGPSATFVSVWVPGGTVGRYRFVTVGAPTLRQGQRAIFLLVKHPDGGWRPVGLAAGVYRIERERSTGLAVVREPIVSAGTPAGPVVRGDVRRRRLTVQEFESAVRLVLSRPLRFADAVRP